MDIRIGCCGMQMARKAYFQRFSLVEVQQTFYQPPKVETLQRWREEAPPGFEFTLKAWQLITHTPHSPTYRRLRQPIPPERWSRYGRFQLTEEVIAAWEVTLQSARALGARIIVFQCPASFLPGPGNLANLRAFFRHIRPQCEGLIPGWEPRGAWPVEVIRELVAELHLLYVVDPFQSRPLPANPFHYFRLHGRGGYNYRYSDQELRQLAGWCGDGDYVLFNNVWMVEDAERFRRLVGGQ